MRTTPYLVDEAIMAIKAHIRICEGIIKLYKQSDIPGVKELLTELEQHSSGEFADVESIALIVGIYASAAEQHNVAECTAILRGTEPPDGKPWGHPVAVRFAIPLKAQFDHSFALNSANKPSERGTDTPPVEPINRFIAVLEQSAALGTPVITHTAEFQIRGHMIFWAVFDAQSATGRMLMEELQKLVQALGEATEWAQLPVAARILDTKKVGRMKVKRHPRPADYVPPDEFEWRCRWSMDRNYIRAAQGRLFYAALPSLIMAWKHRSLLHALCREAAEVEASNAD